MYRLLMGYLEWLPKSMQEVRDIKDLDKTQTAYALHLLAAFAAGDHGDPAAG